MTGLSALHSLTGRGRGLVAVGLVATALGVLAGQRDLIRVGALLLALPCVALAVLARSRLRLRCSRELSRGAVAEGETVQVRLRVENVSRLTTGVLLLSDRLPRVLGDSPRFLLADVQPGRAGQVEYAVRGALRGRYDVGPLSIRLADPFGLCELVRVFPGTLPVVVTPAVEDLPPARLGGDRAAGGEGGSRTMAASGDEDFTTREWRQGDDLRKVHWRSTARTGELMVRQEEQPSRARCLLVLDVRAGAHTGSGPASSVETAVRAAASIGLHLLGSGSGARLVTVGAAPDPATGATVRTGATLRTDAATARRASGRGAPARDEPQRGTRRVDLPSGDAGLEVDGETGAAVLLERLALLAPGRGEPVPLGPALTTLVGSTARESLVVAVLGRLDLADADALARLRGSSRARVAVLTAPGPASDTGGSDDDPAHLLSAAGWQVLRMAPRDGLAAVWGQLGEGRGAGAAAPRQPRRPGPPPRAEGLAPRPVGGAAR